MPRIGIYILLALCTQLLTACVDKGNLPIPKQDTTLKTGKLDLGFQYLFGGEQTKWEMNKQLVHPRTGDTMRFTMFKYYLSNVKLQRADGSWWVEPNSYYLIDAEKNNDSTVLTIPVGEYIAIEYSLGVDSLRNVSGAQTDALDPINGMFWGWDTGYIMTKLEGRTPNSHTGVFALHFGGFSGSNNIVTRKNTTFDRPLKVGDGTVSSLTIAADVAAAWNNNPGLSSFSAVHNIDAMATTMAKDFYASFSVKQ